MRFFIAYSFRLLQWLIGYREASTVSLTWPRCGGATHYYVTKKIRTSMYVQRLERRKKCFFVDPEMLMPGPKPM